ncbi:hypothetical protein MCHI_003291 [Candidatus Magnetoovum chiemensis]|nr:hypothetical protein MCHI_003291 [Candidatus Magnetoovum chiemensis]
MVARSGYDGAPISTFTLPVLDVVQTQSTSRSPLKSIQPGVPLHDAALVTGDDSGAPIPVPDDSWK